MIYLSRLVLNPRSRQAQSEQRNPYELHRTVSRAFGDKESEWTEARCLFRIENARDSDEIVVLVQSRRAPDWDRLVAGGSYLLRPTQTKALELNLRPNARLAFRLNSNPTLYQDGKRRPVIGEPAILEWLNRKGGQHGFRPVHVSVSRPDVLTFRTASGRPVTVQSVLLNGTLDVTDPVALSLAVEFGIGSAKGFGFGLLSLARA